jgi:valyl-tRNA synthetase
VQKKLSNSRFVENAPEKVIQVEKDKEQDALSKIKAIKESLSSFE